LQSLGLAAAQKDSRITPPMGQPDSTTGRRVARNALCNGAGMATHMLVGFLVAPFLVHHLGQTRYGLWILIGSLTGYFAVLDLGVRGSVGRNIAFHRARGDTGAVNALLNTALAYLGAVAGLALLATLALLLAFFHLFAVPPAEAAEVRLALLLVGVNLALTFPLEVFDAVLWACQRFDVLNAVDIPLVLLRAGLTFWLVGTGHGLVALAVITLLCALLAGSAKAVLSFRLAPGLRLAPGFISREAARGLFGYGLWYFLLSTARNATPQVSPLVIGARLGVALVTPFSVAARLVGYANSLLVAGTQVLTPLAAALHAEGSSVRQQQLFLEGGKFCAALVLALLGLFLCLGAPLINLWMGPALLPAVPLLLVLVLGEALPMSQWITYSTILGMGRHAPLACFCTLELLAVVAATLAVAGPFGLVGVCAAVALAAGLCRGVAQLVYGCRLVGVPLGTYARAALLPAVLCVSGPVLVLAALTRWHAPGSWFELFAYGAGYGACCLPAGALLVGRRPRFRLFPRSCEAT
jgi:O-antigen/teichoic acid export membrane protein